MRRPFRPRAGIPAAYPRDLERRVVLPGGQVLRVRPIVPGDAPALRQAIEEADDATIRSRFLGGRRPTDAPSLRHLTILDYDRRLALVALAPDGQGVAIARYEGSEGCDEAEVAVAVATGWRHLGVATALLRLLASAAVARGIHRFRASYYATNLDVRDLAERSHPDGEGGLDALPAGPVGAVVLEEVVPLDDLPVASPAGTIVP